MKKLFLFFMAMIICQYSFGQGVTLKEALEGMSTLYQRDGVGHDFHTSNISEDAAYEAPNSALTKKWFFRNINEYVDDLPGYIQFFPNGTFKMYMKISAFHGVIPGRWQRSKQDLKLTYNYPAVKYINDDMSGYSLRERDNINKERIKLQAKARNYKTETESRKILRMDDLMVLDIKEGLCAYLVSEEYLVNKAKTKAEVEARQAKKAEEEAKKAEEEAAEVIRLGDNINKIFDKVEEMPSFPGGQAAMMQWFDKNLKYPIIAKENDVQGNVLCTFVIERDGSITDVRVVRGVDPSLDKEAVRLLKVMPHWIPGKQDGSKVRVKYTLPVSFKL